MDLTNTDLVNMLETIVDIDKEQYFEVGDKAEVLIVEQGVKKALNEISPSQALAIASAIQLQQEPLIIDSTDENNCYYGYAPVGSLTSASVWKIRKQVVVGDIITNKYVNSGSFTNIWDNRTSLTYV